MIPRVLSVIITGSLLAMSYPMTTVAATHETDRQIRAHISALQTEIQALQRKINRLRQSEVTVAAVPFYSQFADITSPSWQKVGCGIASVAMLIDFYTDSDIDVDTLLDRGIQRGAYLNSAGWIHAGLIQLSQDFGLNGETVSLAHLSRREALKTLESELKTGPVMASVHYTFEPTNPIPHLVVVNRIADGMVYYNDPAEDGPNGSISEEKFEKAWKQRYISIRPSNS